MALLQEVMLLGTDFESPQSCPTFSSRFCFTFVAEEGICFLFLLPCLRARMDSYPSRTVGQNNPFHRLLIIMLLFTET